MCNGVDCQKSPAQKETDVAQARYEIVMKLILISYRVLTLAFLTQQRASRT